MKVLVIATILIISTFAAQDPAMEVIQKLESSKAGRQILDTIQLQMQSGDSSDDLIHMLQALEDELEAEQDVADEAILPYQNECVEVLANYVVEIQQTRTKIQQQEDLLLELRPIKADKEAERADLLDFQALIEQKLEQIAAAKVAKDQEWAEEKEAHDSQTAIIAKAKDIILGGLSASFLQSKAKVQPQVLAQVAQHFNNAKKIHFKRKGLSSIFRVLAQVANSQEIQASGSAVDKIVQICDQLLEKIAESRAIEKTDYDHWVTEYTKTKQQLTDKLNDTKAKIVQLNTEIAVLTKRIGNAENELADARERLQQKIEAHDTREQQCDDAGLKYANERQARDDQRSIISDAIGLLTAKIRILKRYVSDRVQTLERPTL